MKFVVLLLLAVASSSNALFFRGLGHGHAHIHFNAPSLSSSQGLKTRTRILPLIVGDLGRARPIESPQPPITTTTGAEVREVKVPVISSQSVQYVPVPVEKSFQPPQVVAVEPSGQSVHLVFRSATSPLSVQQQHDPAPGRIYETTRTQEQPHIIRHEVLKPVVQELRETIQPYRNVVQEIKPVLEKVQVLVPREQQRLQSEPQPEPHHRVRYLPFDSAYQYPQQQYPVVQQPPVVIPPQYPQQQQSSYSLNVRAYPVVEQSEDQQIEEEKE